MKSLTHALAGLGVAMVTIALVAGPAASSQKPDQPGDQKAVSTRATPASGDPAPPGFANWTQVYAFQAKLNAGAEQIVAADPTGKASIVAGPENHELRVYWPGRRAGEASRSGCGP